jgi:hypothetical protein
MSKSTSIFDLEDTTSLFEEVHTEESQNEEDHYSGKNEPNTSLFDELEEEEDTENEIDPEEEDLEDSLLEDKEKTPKVKKTKPKEDPETSSGFGKGIKALIKNTEDFLVFEGEEERDDYSEEEFVELYNANIDEKVNTYVESTLNNIINSFDPSIQKIIKGQLKGVKVKDIIDDIKEYEEVSSLPKNPTDSQKELIVKKYYKELAKEKKKSEEWVSKTVERIIDTDDLDSEYDDAVVHYEEKIQNKIEEEAKKKEIERQNTIKFKQYHSHVVNEVLKEDELFGIKLKKADKDVIGDVLAGFVIRNSDNKEKMKLTAIIDELIHDKKDPSGSYKKLALMTLAAVNPSGMIASLSDKAETKISTEGVKRLKVADKNLVATGKTTKKPTRKTESFFGN